MAYKLDLLLALALTVLTAFAAVAVPRNGNGNGGPSAGECGGVKYWHGGECMDARDRKSGKTWQQEILEKQWKP